MRRCTHFSRMSHSNPAFSHRTPNARRLALSALLALWLMPAWAQEVQIQNAWVRATVPGQKATGAFMRLVASRDLQLKAVSTPVAGVAQVHEMHMEGNIMKMQALEDGLPLPAGTPVELKPGGLHLMLLDLKETLKADSRVPLTLVFVDAKGRELRRELNLPVSTVAPMGTVN